MLSAPLGGPCTVDEGSSQLLAAECHATGGYCSPAGTPEVSPRAPLGGLQPIDAVLDLRKTLI